MSFELLTAQSSTETSKTQQKNLPVSKRPVTILAAEDYETNRFAMSMLFDMFDTIEARFVSNGSEAVDSVRRHRYDLILMDINMPGLNGIDAARIIHEELQCPTPIIALTADMSMDDARRFRDAGIIGYIIKPITVDDLRQIISFIGLTIS
jgi:CheY-like chemotaxis protein